MAYMRKRFAVISLVLYFITLAVFLTGFAAPYWVTDNFGGAFHFGLWQHCQQDAKTGDMECIYLVHRDNKGYFKATEAFMVMALMATLPASVLIILWVKWSDQRRYALLSSILNAVAGGLAIIGLIIFGAEYKRRGARIHPNGWAFWVTVMSSALLLLQGIIWTIIVLVPGLGFHYKASEAGAEDTGRREYKKASHHPAGLY